MKQLNPLSAIYSAVYRSLKFFEGGFGNQTNSARAAETEVVISFAYTMNLVTIWPKLREWEIFFLILVISLIVNHILFRKVLREQDILKSHVESDYILLGFGYFYILVTCVGFYQTAGSW